LDNIKEYWKLGGRLNRNFFEIATSILDNGMEKPNKNNCCLSQAKSMARIANIEINLEQENLYVFLRDLDVRNTEENGSVPTQLSDQTLLAETLLLTKDIPNLNTFMNRFPHIFHR
jgi:hypothetical protein